MVAHSEERIFRMAEGQMALGDEGKSGVNIGKMIYSMGDSAGRAYLIAGEESGHRAYLIGLLDDGSIGEGTDGKSLYHTMAESSIE
jgi:hypothetical protein